MITKSKIDDNIPISEDPNFYSQDLIQVYHSYIQIILEFNAPLFVSIKSLNNTKLERINKRCHRIICGAAILSPQWKRDGWIRPWNFSLKIWVLKHIKSSPPALPSKDWQTFHRVHENRQTHKVVHPIWHTSIELLLNLSFPFHSLSYTLAFSLTLVMRTVSSLFLFLFTFSLLLWHDTDRWLCDNWLTEMCFSCTPLSCTIFIHWIKRLIIIIIIIIIVIIIIINITFREL